MLNNKIKKIYINLKIYQSKKNNNKNYGDQFKQIKKLKKYKIKNKYKFYILIKQ